MGSGARMGVDPVKRLALVQLRAVLVEREGDGPRVRPREEAAWLSGCLHMSFPACVHVFMCVCMYVCMYACVFTLIGGLSNVRSSSCLADSKLIHPDLSCWCSTGFFLFFFYCDALPSDLQHTLSPTRPHRLRQDAEDREVA